MLRQRLLVTIVLLPLGLGAIALGGVVFAGVVAAILGLAAWEYVHLFKAGGLEASIPVVLVGVLALVAWRYFQGLQGSGLAISALVLVAMTVHLVAFERGRSQAGTDFTATLGGVFYIGWLGAYLISLRELPDGTWWLLLTLSSVWLADSGAFFIGRRFGRRSLSPRLSPKKTWEGYLGGVLIGTLGGALMGIVWGVGAGPGSAIGAGSGALLGLVLSVVTPLGDLGESMIKRQVGIKDSSNLIPGHGGAFDRIDSWLWAAVIGHYLILWLYI